MTERKISQFLDGSLGRFSSQEDGIPVYLTMVCIPVRIDMVDSQKGKKN